MSPPKPSRIASHAGSWYDSSGPGLSAQLDRFLDAVPASTTPIGTESSKGAPVSIPSSGARAIIAPHAGYAYSGPAAAWAYKALDLSNAKRIFLLGPSHHYYLSRCALSRCGAYETPLGDLQIDLATVAELDKSGHFDRMSIDTDEAEHSLEMHLPYIYKMCSRAFSSPSAFPKLVPILVGSTEPATEKQYGALLAPYLSDPSNVFIISSDFCHWGQRFRYTYYRTPDGTAHNLRSAGKRPSNPRIHESIALVDQMCMDAVESGEHDEFLSVLHETGNTVCGRHPIGVMMAAIEQLWTANPSSEADEGGRFKFVRYERSSDCVDVRDSSVSYCSAHAIL
ncbi:UPF0103-domain-containing protein [Eremomyces bilateralis CBS 781.70]|uniref:UPF0103-domain-containing protein n=1 Tax=Eremomyces bilateralis CBS 781.70 TaxID=1392243 RepID=A0A6G1G8A9_9PEZI|nr:UPF0103-domain-containing protein [Eremomyces bilateralis CBS 781.70]KAF1814161.1 UPF0103-domain-containing protein [Eremomyces bilateralis CBS 781.70]